MVDFANKERLFSSIEQELATHSVREDSKVDSNMIPELLQRLEKERRLTKLGLQLQKQSLSSEEVDTSIGRGVNNVINIMLLLNKFREDLRIVMEENAVDIAEEMLQVFRGEERPAARALQTTGTNWPSFHTGAL